MGSIYLTWLADELRAAGARVREYDNQWKSRSRSSGGFSSPPLGVSWHHTAGATNASAQSECDYMVKSSDARPTCNIYIARDGVVWILAAGATNTSGQGGPLTLSRGTVPKDSANTTTVGMEIGNNGVGEQYPQAQIDAAFLASNVINRKIGNQPGDLFSHNLYAPTRKIDPATASAVQGSWKPRSTTSSGTWNTDDIRNEAARRAGGSPTPPPTPDEDDDDMLFDGFWKRNDDNAVYAIFKDGTKQWIQNDGDFNAYAALYGVRGAPQEALSVRVQSDPCMFTAFGLLIGPSPTSVDGVPRDDYGNRTDGYQP